MKVFSMQFILMIVPSWMQRIRNQCGREEIIMRSSTGL